MISLERAKSLAKQLAGDAKIIDEAEARPWVDAVCTALSLIPGASTVISIARTVMSGASESVAAVTLPSPWGPLIVMGPRAAVDGPTYLSVVAHELVHADQIKTVGSVQAGVDYTHEEIRAHREAEAGGVGLWVRYLLTSHRPLPDQAGVVSSSIYHLGPEAKAFARIVVASALASIDTAAVPAHPVANKVLTLLREESASDILAVEYRA